MRSIFLREDEPKGAQANHRAGRFLLYYGWNRLEEAKTNSPGQSDEGAAPWVGIRPEWYALNGQKPHTKKIGNNIAEAPCKGVYTEGTSAK